MQNINKKRKKIIIASAGVVLFVILSAFVYQAGSFFRLPEMFRLNKECQEQGYYMGEFEFKLLGISYWLNKGEYARAITELDRLYEQLKTKEGLIMVPGFKSKEEEMEFYVGLQNPETGAFMDASFPICTYSGPTSNVLEHLDALARGTGRQLKLEYPLKYLDDIISSPKKIKLYLDDVSTVRWLVSKFPQTTFHNARDLLSMFFVDNDDIIEQYGLYNANPEVKTALLEWFYEKQDPETGLWGPMDENGKLRRKDTMNTASILKAFIDKNGNNIHKEFPLRYKDNLAESFLNAVKPVPQDNELDEWHEWNLDTSKSIRTLTRYLWKGLSPESRMKVKAMIEKFIRIKFRKFYIKEEGAFSYYPGAVHATMDGSGFIGALEDYGYCSEKKQVALWGGPEKSCTDKGRHNVTGLSAEDITKAVNSGDINSVRFYAAVPVSANCVDNVLGVFYPRKTGIPDVMELVSKVQAWLNSTSQSMGNWTSREAIQGILSGTKIKPVPVLKQELPVKELNDVLKKNNKLVIIGFDILQIPRIKITYNLR